MFPVLIYIGALICANLSVAAFGPAVTPINAFLFIGLDLALRNWLGMSYTPQRMLGLIATAGAASYLLNPASGMIAVASVVAFVCAALVDWLTFRTITGAWFRRCMGGVAAGALVDSIVFPTLAFGALMPEIVAAQFAAKVFGGAMWAAVILWLKNRSAIA